MFHYAATLGTLVNEKYLNGDEIMRNGDSWIFPSMVLTQDYGYLW